MDDAELTVRVIAASGPPAVDDLTTFLRKRVAENRDQIDSVHAPVIGPGQHLLAIAGGTTALVPLGRFTAHIDAIEATLDKYEAALGHLLRAKEKGWEHNNTQVAMVAYMDVLQLHALEYATHPYYKENWRP